MTLKTDADLAQAMDALATLRLALAALKRDVGARNARNFATLAEGTVDEITRIESEVNEYLGLDNQRGHLRIPVEGEALRGNAAPAAVLTSLLEEHVGPLREIDLDHRTGVVRPDSAPDVTCEFAEELMGAAQEALGRTVRVVGNRADAAGRRRATLFVTRLEIVGDPE